MRYQERIYIQNEPSGLRNKDILNVNMSSDICVFSNPKFNLSGASKVDCDCSCPSGFTLLDGGLCQKITITGATAPAALMVIDENTSSGFYIIEGAVIFEDITNKQWPLITTPQTAATNTYNSVIPSSGTANGVSYSSVSTPTVGIGQHDNVNTPLPIQWPPTGTTGYGLVSPRNYFNGAMRESEISSGVLSLGTGNEVNPVQFLNGLPWNTSNTSGTNSPNWFEDVGIWASGATTGEWYGFSKCVNIPTTKTYYIAFAGNNAIRIKLNGELLVEMNIGDGLYETLTYANIVPITLSAGTNIFYVEALNYSGNGGMAFDIYDTDLATLTAVTSSTQLANLTIFSTASKMGDYFETGTLVANSYSCPTGFLYSNCIGPSCTKIENVACNIITGTSYILSAAATSIPVEFQFTADTNSFTAANATFKYEVYKYNSASKGFAMPPVYKSEVFVYPSFSGTNTLLQNLPISSLLLDGEYIVKGYYDFDNCTDFLNRLGKKVDTRTYMAGSKFGLYDKTQDYYFLAMTEAEKPQFAKNNNNVPVSNQLSQQVIIPGEGQTNVVITNNVAGFFVVTLNGLVLAPNLDYTYSASVITLSSKTEIDDIITIIYTTAGGNNLVGDNINIISPIVSGVTGAEGSNTSYFNTTTGKYEIYCSVTPESGGQILVMLNGATLANGVDYYQSTSNAKRIILEGDLMVGDIITIVYFPTTNVVNGLITNNPSIVWQILNPPQTNNGYFSLEVSTGNTFTTLQYSGYTAYVSGKGVYSDSFTASGSVGTNLYYRVKNHKVMTSVCGASVVSENYSETIPLTIMTNSINSY